MTVEMVSVIMDGLVGMSMFFMFTIVFWRLLK